MKRPLPATVRHAERLYRLLLRCYPPAFRREFAEPMALAFRDSCRDVYRHTGSPGVLLFGITTLADLLATVVMEYLREVSAMSNERLIRWSGGASIVAGLLWIVASASLEGRLPGYTHAVWHLTIAGAALCSLFALVGLYSRYGDVAGRRGQASLLLADLGAALSLIGNLLEGPANWSGGWGIFMLGMLALLTGLTLFALLTWPQRRVPRWNLLPYLVGAIGLLALAPLSSGLTRLGILPEYREGETLWIIAIPLALTMLSFSIGWLTLGYLLWTHRRATAWPPVGD